MQLTGLYYFYRPIQTKVTMKVAQDYCAALDLGFCPSQLLKVRTAQFLAAEMGKKITQVVHA